MYRYITLPTTPKRAHQVYLAVNTACELEIARRILAEECLQLLQVQLALSRAHAELQQHYTLMNTYVCADPQHVRAPAADGDLSVELFMGWITS